MQYIHIIGLKEDTHFGGTTIGYVVNSDKVVYSIAFCHEHDRYTKSIGRDIVNQRFLDNKCTIIPKEVILDYVKYEISPLESIKIAKREEIIEIIEIWLSQIQLTSISIRLIEFAIKQQLHETLSKRKIEWIR